jgi:hypothetical protein
MAKPRLAAESFQEFAEINQQLFASTEAPQNEPLDVSHRR